MADYRARLESLIEPALAVLTREMATADKSADRQRAANSLLDRAGVSRTSVVVQQQDAKQLLAQKMLELAQGPDGVYGPEPIAEGSLSDPEHLSGVQVPDDPS